MRVVVTGGSGFIGSRVVERLRDRGDDVTVLDVVALPQCDVRTVLGSVLDADTTMSAVSGADAVVHLAGPIRAGMRSDPMKGASLQLQGTLNVLESCTRADVAHLAFASSFYVYDGIDPSVTVDEESPLDALGMELFGSCKLMGEALCRDWAGRSGLGVVVFRLGPAYGGGGSSAVDQLVADGLKGGIVEIWGNGNRRNQYTHVGDLAAGICAGLEHDATTYNLVAPEAVSLSDLGDLLSRFGFEVAHDESRPAGPHLPTIDSRKALDALAWAPRRLDQGLLQTIEGHPVTVR